MKVMFRINTCKGLLLLIMKLSIKLKLINYKILGHKHVWTFLVTFLFLMPYVSGNCEATTCPQDSGSVTAIELGAPQDSSKIDRRFKYEAREEGNPFAITPHRPIYFIPIDYNSSPNNAAAGQIGFNHSLNAVEVKFQLSFKLLVWKGVFSDHVNFYVAYTQQSWWQVYNGSISSPFRETNYEPEAFFMIHTNLNVLGAKIRLINIGIDHQSNGRDVPASRSWNRLFTQIVFDVHNQLFIEFRPWLRLPEKEKTYPLDPTGDDNPDITDYMGYGHLRGVMVFGKHTVTFLFRDNLKSRQRAALQLDWSFPLVRKIRGYIQFFTGYGESLIDYNHNSTRIGIGVELTNWL
ncbi:MAG: phospholipase [Calditrichaeota bacterium]|nr:MAG: phospholipase [Calditrichota bacterium]